MLARKGEVTVVEQAGKKTTVALQPFSGAGDLTLQGWTTKEQLLAELYHMCRDWPDNLSNNCQTAPAPAWAFWAGASHGAAGELCHGGSPVRSEETTALAGKDSNE